jgi:putative flippase GtrA
MLSALVQSPAIRQFVTFGLVGTGGFVVDATVLHFALTAGLGFYAGRLLSYLTAATFTWAMNRRFTFRAQRGPDRLREWARFLVANALGGGVNYAVYAILVASSATFAASPVLGVAVGSIAGMFVNFTVNRYVVFRHRA